MVQFLVKRPIAVIMVFIAIMILGLIASMKIPVSLMPDIDIPEISVYVSNEDMPARDLENVIVRTLRNRLKQVSHLSDISSETRDGFALIRMRFDYGTPINYAYIETNEKIDGAMSVLRDIERPQVVKASATDIPVFNLKLTLRQELPGEMEFVELSEFTKAVIVKRIEQLEQVAMVDVTGLAGREIVITPDREKMLSLDLTEDDLQRVLQENNVESFGNLVVREGYYQYNIRFSNTIRNIRDIKNLYLKKSGLILQLKDIARIEEGARESKGWFLSDDQRALCLSIIKQADSRMEDLKIEVDKLLTAFENDYPEISFEMEQDQSSLLSVSIDNLKQSLLLGACLAFLVMFFFLRDFRSPLLIGITIPVSLVISMLFLFLAGISINIISLSGLVLCVGMMIDNSIIVIDNINQYSSKGNALVQACESGTNEVIRPLLSSALTTSAVFIPLIFLSGISGALFFDQALAITVGLMVSFTVSITLLPVLYHLFYLKNRKTGENRFLNAINIFKYEHLYEKGMQHVFRRKYLFILLFFGILASVAVLFKQVRKNSLPDISQDEMILKLDWNENLHLGENTNRIYDLLGMLPESVIQRSALVGEQQFLMKKEAALGANEASIYLRTASADSLAGIQNLLRNYLNTKYPDSKYSFNPPDNIFELIFSSKEPDLLARVNSVKSLQGPDIHAVNKLKDDILKARPGLKVMPIPLKELLVLQIDPEMLLLYDVSYRSVQQALLAAFGKRQSGTLKNSQSYIPMVIAGEPRLIHEILDGSTVFNSKKIEIPLRSMIKTSRELGLKYISAGRETEFVPLVVDLEDQNPNSVMQNIKQLVRESGEMDVSFTGKVFESEKLFKELVMVLLISMLLLYFILAAQFESFIQPLIVLIELPVDIAGALLLVWIFGDSLNIMSAIGIIVMSGIIINDSILKIDTINRIRKGGLSLKEAIFLGGERRLRPILMTSITSILALLPFLFFSGLGAELQKPLALAVIGGMTIGTFVSLYFIPLAYYFVYRKSEKK